MDPMGYRSLQHRFFQEIQMSSRAQLKFDRARGELETDMSNWRSSITHEQTEGQAPGC